MSKSYGNVIDVFLPKKQLKKQCMGVVTDSTPLEDPKNPDECNVFALYALLAKESEIETMRQNYLGGNYGFGHAKLALFELILREFEQERIKFYELIANPKFIWSELKKGADKARPIAKNTIKRVRKVMGY